MIDKTKRMDVMIYPLIKNVKKWDKKAKKLNKSRSKYIEDCMEVFHTKEIDKC